MNMGKVSFSALVVVLAGIFVTTADGQSPCYDFVNVTSQFTSMFNFYDPAALSIEVCRYGCAGKSFRYSGIMAGQACFCSQTLFENTTSADPSVCSSTCTGSQETCGGPTALTVAETPKLVSGFTVSAPENNVPMFQDVNITFSVEFGAVAQYSVDFGDGLKLTTPDNMTSHKFHAYGNLLIQADVLDVEGNSKASYTNIQMAMPLSTVKVLTDATLPTERVVVFDIFVATGSGVNLTLDVDDGTEIPPFQLPDNKIEYVGPEWGVEDESTLTTRKTYLMINHLIKNTGHVLGWKYNAKTTGDIKFQIFRPTCSGEELFCYRSYSCYSPDTGFCNRTTSNFWARQCSSKYSFSSQECITEMGKKEPFYFTSTWSNLPHKTFSLVGETLHTVTETGLGWVTLNPDLSNAIAVQKGDVLAVYMTSASLHSTTGTSGYVTYYGDPADPFTSSPSTNSKMIHLEALVVTSTRMKVSHMYFGEGFFANVSVNISDVFGNVARDNITVDVQESIRNVSLETEPAATTFVPFEFYIPDHYGNKVFYNITFGDGSELHTSSRNFSHNYTEAGVYAATVFAYNDISNMSYTIWFPVQDAISPLNTSVIPDPSFIGTVLTQSTQLFAWIANGTNVTFSFDMGDGNVIYLYHDQDPLLTGVSSGEFILNSACADPCTNSSSSSVVYTYQSTDNFTVNVTVFNLISSQTVILYLPVEIPIVGLEILQPPPIPYLSTLEVFTTMVAGSRVHFTSHFDSAPAREFNMTWEELSGSVVLALEDYKVIGPHDLLLEATNFVEPRYANHSVVVWVDYVITAPQYTVNTSHVRPGEVVGYNLTMTNGSRMNISVDYDDGVVDEFYIEEMLTGDYFLFSHAFDPARFYNVTITIINPVSNATLSHFVTCQNPVVHIDWTTNSPVSVYPWGLGFTLFNLTFPSKSYLGDFNASAQAPLNMTVSSGAPEPPLPPTDAFYLATFGDPSNPDFKINTPFYVNDTTIAQYNYSYPEFATYPITINMSNFVSHMYLTGLVVVDQPVLDLQIECDQLLVTFNQTLITCSVTMTWGSRLNITWDWEDDTVPDITAYNRNGTNIVSHLYAKVGVYHTLITTENSVGTVYTNLPSPVIVQHPVVNEMRISGVSSVLMGNPHYWSLIAFDIQVPVGVPIPTNASYTVDFKDGNHLPVTRIWESDRDPSRDTAEFQHMATFVHNYTFGDTYNISMNIYNLMSNKTFYFNFRILEAIYGLHKKVYSLDLESAAHQNGTGIGNAYYPVEEEILLIATLKRASHVTYFWDFGDGQTATTYPAANITHKYADHGTYKVCVNSSNPLTFAYFCQDIHIQRSVGADAALWAPSPSARNRSVSYLIFVGALPATKACYFLDCKDENSDNNYMHFFGDMVQCRETYPTKFNVQPRQFWPLTLEQLSTANVTVVNTFQTVATFNVTLRITNQVDDKTLTFRQGVTRGPCSFPKVDMANPLKCDSSNCDSQQNKKHLKSEKLVVMPIVIINCESTQIANYTWKMYKVDETTNTKVPYDPGFPLTGSPLPKLEFPERMLDYGLYCWSLNVSMWGENGIFNKPGPQSEACVRIIKTELVLTYPGVRRLQWGKNHTFNVIDESHDPDVGLTNKSGITYRYFCRRECETEPVYDENFNIITPMTTYCNYTNNTETGKFDRGCNMYDGIDSSGLLAYEGGRPRVDLGEFYENAWALFTICIYKDTRRTCVDSQLKITPGEPPELTLQCIANCLSATKVNPLKKFTTTSSVTGARPGQVFVFSWRLSRLADPTGSFLDAVEVPQAEWTECIQSDGSTAGVSTGLNIKSLSAEAGLFLCLDKTVTYFLDLKAYRQGGDPSNFGQTLRKIIVNKPPKPGNCTCDPCNGTALETTYNSKCYEPFIDEDVPIKYSLMYRKGLSGPFNILQTANFDTMPEAHELPPGMPERGYQVTMMLCARDAVGSETCVEFFPYVYKATDEKMASVVAGVIGGTGQNPLASAAASGNDAQMGNVISAIASTVAGGENSTSEDSLKLIEKCASEAAKLEPTGDTVNQLMSAGLSVTSNPGGMTADASSSATSCASNVASFLERGEGGEQTNEMVSSAFFVAENIQKAAKDNGADKYAGVDVQSKLCNAVLNKMVPGEKPTSISTGSSTATMASSNSEDLMGATFGSGGTDMTMDDPSSLLGEGNDTLPSLNTQVTASNDNVFGDEGGNSTSAAGVQSQVVGISFTNATGHPIKNDVKLELHISVPNPPPIIRVTRRVTTDPKDMIINQVRVTAKSAMMIEVNEGFNTTVDNSTDTNTTTTPFALSTSNGTETFSFFMSTTSAEPTTTPSGGSSGTETTTMTNDGTTQFTVNCTAQPNHTLCVSPVNCTQNPNHTDCQPVNCTAYPNVTECQPTTTNTVTTTQATTTAAPTAATVEELDLGTVIKEIQAENAKKSQFTVYFGLTAPPTVEKYDFKCTVPQDPVELLGDFDMGLLEQTTLASVTVSGDNITMSTTSAPGMSTTAGPVVDTKKLAKNLKQRNMNACFLNRTLLNFDEDGTIYMGVTGVKSNYTAPNITVTVVPNLAVNASLVNATQANSTSLSRSKREILWESAPKRVRRSTTSTSGSSTSGSSSGSADQASDDLLYEMGTFTAQCKYYNPYSLKWETDGCEVGPLTTPQSTHCICTRLIPLPPTPSEDEEVKRDTETVNPNMIRPEVKQRPTAFGCGLGVPMNTINPNDSAFLKLDSNPVIFSVMVALICLYLITLIWAKKADQNDDLKAATTPLMDNDPRHKYVYEIIVYTGSKSRSGTTSHVSMIFSGEEDETVPRLIFDNKRKVMQRGSVDSFLMAVPRTLGPLSHIRVWHDNSGTSPSWFFSRMVVKDLQTDDQFFFIADKWLAVEEEDGLIDRMVPLAGREELTNFNHLFWTKTKNDFSDGHIWFSVFGRPVKSTFTRCQRLTCCISLLFCTMMANIFFYDTEDSSAPAQEFAIGPITFTIPALLTGIYSTLLVFPINLIIVMLFRYAKPPKTKWQKEKEKAIADAKKALKRNQLTAEDELRQQKEFLETGDHNKRLMMGSQSGISFIDTESGEAKVAMTNAKKKKKGPFRLPHWIIYPAYLLCLASCGTAFYFTVEVGGVFGAKKSNEWMVSFVMSIFQSIFLTQPLKVLGLAMFYALVIKKPEVEVDDSMAEPGLGKGEEYLHKTENSQLGEEERQFRKSLSKYKNIPVPPDEEYLKAAKAQRMKELAMQSILMEIAAYLFFLYLLMMVGYGNRDPWSNTFYQSIRKEFADGSYFDSKDMDSVSDYPSFWEWTESTMIPAVYGDTWYNGEDYWFQVGFFADRNNYLMGIPRIRQVRNKPHNCRMPVYRYVKHCHNEYDIAAEDQDNYRQNWVPVNESNPSDIPDESFEYRNSTDLDGLPVYGEIGYYGGGGYVVELSRDKDVALKKLAKLKAANWIDQDTRAVFIEFVAYNPALNLHGISFMVFEFLTTGAIYPDYRFYIMRLDRYVGAGMLALIIAELGAAIWAIYAFVRELRKIKREKVAYFKEFWNIVEFGVAIMMLVAIVMFIYRFVLTQLVQANYRSDKVGFVNFQYPASWDEIYGYLIAFIIYINTTKFLKLLRFNKKMNQVGMTIKQAASPIMSFLVVLGVIFFAYAVASFLIFGRVLKSFSSFIASSETLFSMMLNKFDYQELETANPVFAPIVFISFVVFMVFMLVNFLLTIILEAYAVVKMELARQENQYEMVEFIVGRFKGMIGLTSGPQVAQTDQLMDSLQTKTRDVNRKLAEMMERVEDYVFTSGLDQHVIMDEIDTIEQKRSQALRKKIVTG